MHFEDFKLSMNMSPKKTNVKITKSDVLKWIKRQRLNESTKKKLIKELQSYPANTMQHFFSNIEKHIIRIENER